MCRDFCSLYDSLCSTKYGSPSYQGITGVLSLIDIPGDLVFILNPARWNDIYSCPVIVHNDQSECFIVFYQCYNRSYIRWCIHDHQVFNWHPQFVCYKKIVFVRCEYRMPFLPILPIVYPQIFSIFSIVLSKFSINSLFSFNTNLHAIFRFSTNLSFVFSRFI